MSDDKETDELWELAVNTPSGFKMMVITDRTNGNQVVVDQSLDSEMKILDKDSIDKFNEQLINAYLYFNTKPYTGFMEGIHSLRTNNLFVDFGDMSGEKAYNWFKRYLKAYTKVLSEGIGMDLKKMEDDYIDWSKTNVTTCTITSEGV